MSAPVKVRNQFINSEQNFYTSQNRHQTTRQKIRTHQENKSFTPFSDVSETKISMMSSKESFNKTGQNTSKGNFSEERRNLIKLLNYNKFQKKLIDNEIRLQQYSKFENSFSIKKSSEKQETSLLRRTRMIPTSIDRVNKKEDHNKSSEEEKNQNEESEGGSKKPLVVYSYTITENMKWRPSVREGPSLEVFQNNCYLYGGLSAELYNDWSKLSLNNWSWSKVTDKTSKGEAPYEGRFGHSCNLYKNQFYIFGGERKYNKILHSRECYRDIITYDPLQCKWSNIKPYGSFIEGRRNHCACVVSQFLFIFGGLNSRGEILKDLNCVNLETLKCTNLEYKAPFNSGVAYTNFCPVFKSEIKLSNPYEPFLRSKTNTGYQKALPQIEYEGIYFYGGFFDEKVPVATQKKLFYLPFGDYPLRFRTIPTNGQGPPQLKQHTINFQKQLQILVIYGGRTPENDTPPIHILNLKNLTWVRVACKGLEKVQRSRHCANFIDTKLLIYGGYIGDVFSSNDFTVIEFEKEKVRQMLKAHKEKLSILKKYKLINLKYMFKRELASNPDNNTVDVNVNKFQAKDFNTIENQMFALDNKKKDQSIQIEHQDFSIPSLYFKDLRTYQPLPARENNTYNQNFLLKKKFNFII